MARCRLCATGLMMQKPMEIQVENGSMLRRLQHHGLMFRLELSTVIYHGLGNFASDNQLGFTGCMPYSQTVEQVRTCRVIQNA